MRVMKVALAAALLACAGSPAAAQQYFGQNQVHYDRFDWQVLETEHFQVHYYPAIADAAMIAARMAERAYALGARVGPLCRRHWATLEQLRQAEGDAAGVGSAREQIQACRVTGPERY